MNYITLNEKDYPVFFGGAAIRRLWESIDSKVLGEITAKIAASQNDKQIQVTDKELFTVFVPVVKWGVWGGQRFEGSKVQPLDGDDIADWLYPDNMGEGMKALLYFFESMPRQQNGESLEPVEDVKKKARPA